VRETLFCVFPSTSGRVVSHQVRCTRGYMDTPLIWRLWCLRMPIIHSVMTKWRCSKCSERIWSTSRLAISTPVPCDSCVCQVTHSQWFCGDPGLWRDDVLGCDRYAISLQDVIKLKAGLPTFDHHPNRKWHSEHKAGRLPSYEKVEVRATSLDSFSRGLSPEWSGLRMRRGAGVP